MRAYVDECLAGVDGPARTTISTCAGSAALVAEAYRILTRGGVFLYPADARPGYGNGRLRLALRGAPDGVADRAGRRRAPPRAASASSTSSPQSAAPARAADPRLARRGRAHRARLHLRSRLLVASDCAPLFARARPVPRCRSEATRMSDQASDHLRSPAPPAPARPRSSKTFEQIFRREKVDAAYIEGDAFHRYDRAEMRDAAWRRRPSAATSISAISAPRPTCSRSSKRRSATMARPAPATHAALCPRRRGGRAARRGARHLHRVGATAGRHRPAVLRGPARRRRHRRRSTSRAMPT